MKDVPFKVSKSSKINKTAGRPDDESNHRMNQSNRINRSDLVEDVFVSFT